MKMLSQRQTLLASTILCGVSLLGASQALAQSTSTTPEPTEVVVTGSRIPRQNLNSVSGMTIVSAGEIKAEGTVNVETLLNNLPSVFAGQNSTVSNGSSGTATVDLRGLGPSRTLVLIDGRRMQAGDPALPVADLNFIPSALVDRVDVLTGGASSAYGADAVAGVVNFVMKRNFEGVQFDFQRGIDQHDNDNGLAKTFLAAGIGGHSIAEPGNVWQTSNDLTSLILGVNTPDKQGNVTAYVQYSHLFPITQDKYDYSACTVTDSSGPAGGTNTAHVCAGSSNSAYGRFNLLGQAGSGRPTALSNYGATAGTFAPFSNGARFNYGPYNYFQREDQRYDLGSFAHYEINKHFDVYADAMMMDDHTYAQIAPSGYFQGATYYIPCNNAFLTGTQPTQLGCGSAYEGGGALAPAGTPVGTIATTIGYRFAAADAPRRDDIRHDDYRIVVGTKGSIIDGWTYDAYLQYGETVYAEEYLNDASITKLQNALYTTSTTTCVSGGACVPINIFSAAGPSQAAINYVLTPGFKEGSTTEQVAEADVVGDLGRYGLKSPFANEGVKVSLGVDYRREELVEQVDQENISGDLSGSGGATPPAAGSFTVREAYFETRAPLVTDQVLVKSLNFEAGYRSSEYSSVGHTDTYKFAGDWSPISDIKFRASYNHAVRAPNIDELYTPSTVGLFSGQDPCSGVNQNGHAGEGKTYAHPATDVGVGLTAAQCVALGVPLAEFGTISPCPASQCSALGGGNAALKPETSNTVSYGVVITPSFIRNLSITVDYYDIKVLNDVGSIPSTLVLADCAATGTFCNLIHRDAFGSLASPTGYVIGTLQNTGYNLVKGIDVEVNYRVQLSDFGLPHVGSLSVNYVGSYAQNAIVQSITGGGTYDCAGLFGTTCGNPDPHWRSKMRLTWSSPWNFDISGQWRYLGSTTLDANSSNPLLANGGYDPVDGRIPAYNYFDLTGNWRIRDGFTVRAGVNNIFDKDPPIIDGGYGPTGPLNGNTFPGVYDALGRTLFVGLTAKF
jgi:outer membrane receptor protein involved in Fe transport